jgi:hypothetical protein
MPNSNARKRFLQPDSIYALSEEFTEARLLRLAASKPKKLNDLGEASQVLEDVRKFRVYMRDSTVYGSAGYGYKRGWGMHDSRPIYVATTSRIARFDLLIEDLEERVIQLEKEDSQKTEALKGSKEATRQFAQTDSIYALSEEFTEARLFRLTASKPDKLNDLGEASQVLEDVRKFRVYMRDSTVYGSAGYGYKRGWGMHDSRPSYIATTSRIARFDLLIEDLEERVIQLEKEDSQKTEALKRSKEATRQFARIGQDKKLAGALWHALDTTPPTVGFIYLKRWTMPDGSCWFKIGITNNPDRREKEQNVLPVAAESIVCVDVGSMDRARAIEFVIHQVLEEQRIKDANNRELFHLSAQQASAVKAVLKKLV